MPLPSRHITGIFSSAMEGWETYVEAVKMGREGHKVYNLAIGDHDFPTPQPIVDAAKHALDAGHHHYNDVSGTPELLDALAKVSSEATGVETIPDEVIVTAGGQGSLFAAMQATLNPEDHAIMISPFYVTYPGTIRANADGFSVVEALAENGFQPDADSIRAAIRPNTRALLINTPNNPTGVIYTRETLEAIAEVCIEHDLWLVSDEVYWSLTGGAHISPRSLPGMKDRTLVINSMSKSHAMTGWRVGWLTGPAHMMEHLDKLNLVTTYGISDFISRAAVFGLNNRSGVDEIAETYRRRRALLADPLDQIDGLSVVPTKGGMYVMVDIRALTHDAPAFAMELLKATHVASLPGDSFGASTKGHIRFSLCAPDDELPEVAKRVADFVSTYEKN